MTPQQYSTASGNAEWSLLLGESLESHEIATCLTQAVSPPTSATLSGRDTPTGGLYDPWEDECAEDDKSALMSLGEELAPCWLDALQESIGVCGEERFRHDETQGAAFRIEGYLHGHLFATSGPAIVACREETFEHGDMEAGAEIAQIDDVWYGALLGNSGPTMSMNGSDEAERATVPTNTFSHGNQFETSRPPARMSSESADQFGADLGMGAECPFCWPVDDALLIELTGGEGHALLEPCMCSQNVARPAGHGTRFELVVHSNVALPSCLPQCNCRLCTLQGIVVANTLPLIIEGRFVPDLPRGDVWVELQYVVVHEPSESGTSEIHCRDAWMVQQLGTLTRSALQIEVPAKELGSTYHAVVATKKVVASKMQKQFPGTFHTYFRAEVMCLGANRAQSFRAYSPEVHVCGDRNLRRLMQEAPQH